MQDFYGFPAYDAHRDEYETLGLNEHDSVMFSCYIHADNNVFSPDVIKSLDQMAANDFKKDINPAYIKSLIKSVLNLTRYQTGILIVLMLFISGAFIIDKKNFIYGFLSVLLMLAELTYLYHINRVLERSFILPVLGVYLVLIYMIAAFVVSLIGRPVMQSLRKLTVKGRSAPDWLLAILTILIIFLVIGLLVTRVIPIMTGIVRDASIFNSRLSAGSNPLEAVNQWLIGLFPSLGPDFDATALLLGRLREAVSFSSVTSLLGSVASAVTSLTVGLFATVFIAYFFIRDDF